MKIKIILLKKNCNLFTSVIPNQIFADGRDSCIALAEKKEITLEGYPFITRRFDVENSGCM